MAMAFYECACDAEDYVTVEQTNSGMPDDLSGTCWHNVPCLHTETNITVHVA